MKRNEELEAEDAFCEKLYRQYLSDPDRGQYMTEEELCKELGIEVDA